MSQFHRWGSASQLPYPSSLGKPLPYQQADRTQAIPKAINLYPEGTITYYPAFRQIIRDFRVCTYVFLPRLPWV